MPGRRWSDGLHQAVEAKEGVQVEGETQTLATITIQNYFRMYEKLAGMTGTAETEESEFYTDLQARRRRHPDQPADPPRRPATTSSTRRRREKYNAIADEIERLHGLGLPVLVGTVTRGGVRDAEPDAQAARAQAQGAERQVPPARGGDRGRGGAARRGHDRDQHGRPRHRHQARPGPRPDHRGGRPADHRHRAARVPAHRPPAARPLRPPGRPGPVASSSSRSKTT